MVTDAIAEYLPNEESGKPSSLPSLVIFFFLVFPGALLYVIYHHKIRSSSSCFGTYVLECDSCCMLNLKHKFKCHITSVCV